jgi:hypothetical protein
MGEIIGDAYYDDNFERKVQSLKPLIFKYFKVWYELTGWRDPIDLGHGCGVDEAEYEEVGREGIAKEEYEIGKRSYEN